ncbi:hypothetical protein D5R81_14980 [Parashewanella spongiae]|uniref:Uncharacterized protein n=1 Tax=Parashewanella spongiae TaxID=342950 RepID=A0A3A6TI78_9GAMM|nr:DUF6776 family protein [Parashewanella spongiae]MCL1079223.1 hypothetical protein [Parashewanella spongiae]RJY07877.1 hypothetical protein D5R81_14980 [Parashewanella spongiae]
MPNYERWRNRLQVIEHKYLPLNRYLFLIVVLAFCLGVVSYYYSQDFLSEKSHEAHEIAKLKKSLNHQAQELATRNLEISIEKEANANMEVMFLEQEHKIKKLARELSFYRSIMTPEKTAEGISVYDLKLEPSIIQDKKDLTLVLIQQSKRQRSVKGHVQLTLIGVKDGKEVRQSLNELSQSKFKFNFRFFQELNARLSLPSEVDWKKVLVKVIVPASRWSKAQQTERGFEMTELEANKASLIQDAVDDLMQQKALKDETKVEAGTETQ